MAVPLEPLASVLIWRPTHRQCIQFCRYTWEKNGKPYDWQVYDDRISQQPGRGTLVITSPRDEDIGKFFRSFESRISILRSMHFIMCQISFASFKNRDWNLISTHGKSNSIYILFLKLLILHHLFLAFQIRIKCALDTHFVTDKQILENWQPLMPQLLASPLATGAEHFLSSMRDFSCSNPTVSNKIGRLVTKTLWVWW